jgi:hypothetical protein
MRRITRKASTFSISLLVGAVATLSAATAAEAPEPAEYHKEVIEIVEVEPKKGVVAQKPKAAKPMHREMRAAFSKDAKDKEGYELSLYRGKHYHKDQERFRWCVMKRESHHNYRAANKSSSARGAYQFLDNNWRNGLVHMMVKESKKNKDGLIPKMRELPKKPIHHWNRYYQDRAFFTALNYNGKWSGKKHWNATVKGTGC